MTLLRRSRLVVFVLLVLILSLTLVTASALGQGKPQRGEVSVGDISFVDIVTFPTGTTFAGTEVGGLSGITYDGARDVYYVLSDDRSEEDPSRYYTVEIDVSGGQLAVNFVDVTFLRDENGDLFAPFAIDPEGIELVRPGQLYVSTEGDDDTVPVSDPEIMRFNPVGRQTREMPVPDKYLYTVDDGNQVRDNLAFESITSTPDQRYLYVATENALENDGPISTLDNYSPSRFLQYHLPRQRPLKEYVYCVDPIPQAPVPPDEFADHGLVEIQALDNAGTFLTMERSFAVGVGNTILLFEASTDDATDVSGETALNLDDCPTDAPMPMSKELLANLGADFSIALDNVEGMAFGPEIAPNERMLILVSDNNFNPSQTTQFIALTVELVED